MRNNKGFNLLTLSVIVVALSILMSVVLDFYSITNYRRRILTTKQRFQDIELALKNYILKNNRFPCPAPLNCNSSSCSVVGDYVGTSKVDVDNNCDIDNLGVFESNNSNSNKIYYGGIPALSIGLDNNYIIDAWGNKIVYIIPKELTEKDSYQKFLYAKHHTNTNDINVNGESIIFDREYIKDGIIYLLISFNQNNQGAYSYDNKKVNYFSGTDNYPIQNFTININKKGLLLHFKTYENFEIEGVEKEKQICPDFIDSTTYPITLNFKSGKYGEIVFSDEFCPSLTHIPAQPSDYYYLSTYRDENDILINNKPAKKCGKNGEWEDGFVYSCELLPKCSKPANDSRFSLLDWGSFDFEVSNMGEVYDDGDTKRLKCIYNKEDGAKWYEI